MNTIKEIHMLASEIYPDSDSAKYKQKFIREEILRNGATHQNIWMNKQYATDFMLKSTSSEFVGRDGFLWKDMDGNIVFFTIEESKKFISVILDKLDRIYLGTDYEKYRS